MLEISVLWTKLVTHLMPRLQHPLSSTFGNYDFSMLSLSSAVIWTREKEQGKVK
jgi:hypothetical protein